MTARCAIAALACLAIAGCGDAGTDGDLGKDVKVGAWGGAFNPGGEPVRGGTLRIDQAAPPESLSSLHFLKEPDNALGQIVVPVFDRLVEFLPGSFDPQPGLAERWTVSKDGKTLTFELRKAQFSNGMPVTSADVKWVLDRARGPESFAASLFATVTSVEAPSESTVVVRLSKPTPGLLFNLTTPGVSIVPAKLVKRMGVEAFNNRPVGSGPFVVDRWRRDQYVVLKRNPRYWRKGLPYLNEVRVNVTPDDNTRALDIESGTVDIADYPPFSQVRRIDHGDSMSVLVAPGADMNVIWINNAKQPFRERNVRLALNYATPVEAIIDVVFKGLAPRMNTVIPKLKYWTRKSLAYPYDPEKAKRLLPRGFSATVMLDGRDQASSLTAQILQQAWRKIGVKLKIKPLENAILGDEFLKGKYELALFRPGAFTSDVAVDDQFAELIFNSPALHNLATFYDNPVTKKLARDVVVELNERKRVRMFERLHVESMKDPPVVPLVYTPNRAAVSDDVHDFNYMLGGTWRLERTWIE